MTKISILVAAYNKEKYIGACLRSLISQTFKNLEIIVVDDASLDGTSRIIHQYAEKDERIKILTHKTNQGLHNVRKHGVEACTGDYVLFVDGDDELELTACEVLENYMSKHPCDILRYGLTVFPGTKEDEDLAYSYEVMFNATNGDLTGEDIVRSSYSDCLAHWTVWNMITNLFRRDLLCDAFKQMPEQRLNKIEDAYEYFVVACGAKQLNSFVEYRPLRYHIGRGISGRSQTTVEAFNKDQESAYAVFGAFRRFVDQHPSDLKLASEQWFEYRVHHIVADDFETRLYSDDQAAAVQHLSLTWGKEATSDMLLDLMLKRANWLYGIGKYPESNDDIVRWNTLFSSLKPQKFTSEIVQKKYNDYAAVWDDIEFRERARLEQIKQKKMERERILREREEARVFRKGSVPQKILDGAFPEGTKRRNTLRSIGHVVLRR